MLPFSQMNTATRGRNWSQSHVATAQLHLLHRHPSQSLARLTQPWLLAALPRLHKELQPQCLFHLSRPPRPPGWRPTVPQDGHQPLREAALAGIVAIPKGQPPFPSPSARSGALPVLQVSVGQGGWLLLPWLHHATSSLDFPHKSPGMRPALALYGCTQTQAGDDLSASAHAALQVQWCSSPTGFNKKLPATVRFKLNVKQSRSQTVEGSPSIHAITELINGKLV